MAVSHFLRSLTPSPHDGPRRVLPRRRLPLRTRAAGQMRSPLFEAIVARAQDGILVTTPSLEAPEIVYVNDALVQITGYPARTLLGASPEVLDGPGTDVEAVRRIRAALREGRAAQEELMQYTRAGIPYWADVRVAPITDASGRLLHFVSLHRDITERKVADHALAASQARYHALSRLISAYAFAYRVHDDRRLELEWMTDTVRDVLGYAAAEMRSHPLATLVHADDAARWNERHARVLRGEELSSEFRLRTRAGAYRWMRVYAYPECDADGRVTFVYGAAQDVTVQKESEAELIGAKEQAEEMMRLKDAFLANMSHEIRTPLTSILGFADILQYELGEEHQEMVEMIQSGGRRLMDTLTSVLELSRLRAQRVTPHLQPLDVAALARETVALLAPQAARQQNVLRAVTPETPLFAVADRAALERVLTNLVSNALKFTPQGEVRVEVSEELGGVVLRVCDTGPGIAEAFLPRLFDEFQQESTGLARSHEGAGLGLAISKRLVELMGGSIGVDSEKDVGSTFWIWLPPAA